MKHIQGNNNSEFTFWGFWYWQFLLTSDALGIPVHWKNNSIYQGHRWILRRNGIGYLLFYYQSFSLLPGSFICCAAET